MPRRSPPFSETAAAAPCTRPAAHAAPPDPPVAARTRSPGAILAGRSRRVLGGQLAQPLQLPRGQRHRPVSGEQLEGLLRARRLQSPAPVAELRPQSSTVSLVSSPLL